MYACSNFYSNFDGLDFNFNFENEWISLRLIEHLEIEVFNITNLKTLIIELINNGCYIMLNLDDFYVPLKIQYKKHHFTHINFLYGYNIEGNSFDTIGFDHNYNFRTMEISIDSIINGYRHSENRNIVLFRPKHSEHYQFDLNILKNKIINFLLLDKPITKFHYLDNKEMIIYSGMSAQKLILTYLNEVIKGYEHNDLRTFHILWEHKKCMHTKMKFLQDNKLISNADYFVNKYNLFVETSLIFRNMFIKYIYNKDVKLLSDIMSDLESLTLEEEIVLKRLIEII